MKDIKKRFEIFSFYDHMGMERHLEEMAKQGWILERLTNSRWVYRRAEPQRVHVTVSYDCRRSVFDPDGKEGEREEMFRHTGWKLVASSGKMQIFYNWEEDPLPLETDPVTEVESLHKAMRQSYLPIYVMYLVLGLFWTYDLAVNFAFNPIGLLSGSLGIYRGVCGAILLLMVAVELVGYYRWRHRALHTAEQGVFLETKGHGRLQQVALCAVLIAFVIWVLDGMLSKDEALQITVYFSLILLLLVAVVVPAFRDLLKRRGVSRRNNRIATFVLAYGVTFVIVGVMIGVLIRGEWRSPGVEEVALRVTDLMEVNSDDYDVDCRREETVWLEQTQVWQLTERDMPQSADIPDMIYTSIQVKVPALYGMCQAQLLRQEEYRQVDAQPWAACEAYQKYREDRALTSYLLCYEQQLVTITFGWEPTQEQMNIVGEKLGGELH